MSGWALKTRKWITRVSLIGLTRLIKAFASIMPYYAGVRAGGVLGCIGFYLLPRERKRAIAHLTLVFGDKDRRWIRLTAKHCFEHLGRSMLEILLISPGRLKEVISVTGEENLRAAMSQGKGAVFVTGHIGNWELMGHTVSSWYPLSVVAAPIEPEQVNDMIVGLRARMGVRTILRGRPGAAKELIRVFRENRVLGILIDQDTDVESVFVDFMGRPAWTPIAAASMAVKFGAPVIYGYIHRDDRYRHRITIEGPLQLVRTGDEANDLAVNTAMLTKKIEESIFKDPEQWVWMHRRWRRQP